MIRPLVLTSLTLIFILGVSFSAVASDSPDQCHKLIGDKALECASDELHNLIPKVHNARWRDQSYREHAKIMARANDVDSAIALIDMISNEDTKALTIRAIGIALKETDTDETQKNAYFDKLHSYADAIDHRGSKEIALTYLAIAEASSSLLDRALQTTLKIETQSLRNKSYQEIAEVMSSAGEDENAFIALQHIEDHAFKNKAYGLVALIFSKKNKLDSALKAADHIEDPYIKSKTLFDIINTSYRKNTTTHTVKP